MSSKRPLVHSVQTLGNSDQDGTTQGGGFLFTYMCSLMFMVNVGIYNSPMDPMGMKKKQLVMMKIPELLIYRTGSMGLVYLPTFTININQM